MEVKMFDPHEENKYIKALEVGIITLSIHRFKLTDPELIALADEDLKNLYQLKAILNDLLKDFKNIFGEV